VQSKFDEEALKNKLEKKENAAKIAAKARLE